MVGAGIQPLADAFPEAQALETGGGQDDAIVAVGWIVEFAEASADVAADVLDAEMGVAATDHGGAADGGGADHGVGGEVGEFLGMGWWC